jgi:hypothetical protein
MVTCDFPQAPVQASQPTPTYIDKAIARFTGSETFTYRLLQGGHLGLYAYARETGSTKRCAVPESCITNFPKTINLLIEKHKPQETIWQFTLNPRSAQKIFISSCASYFDLVFLPFNPYSCASN